MSIFPNLNRNKRLRYSFVFLISLFRRLRIPGSFLSLLD
jgi:hypothetical protein